MAVKVDPATIQVVAATKDDIGCQGEMRRLAMRPVWSAISPQYEALCRETFFTATEHSCSHLQWVKRDDICQGAFAIEEEIHTITVSDLFIHPLFKRLGIGTTVMQALVRQAQSDRQDVLVRFDTVNAGMMALLKKLGFYEANVVGHETLMRL